MGHRARQHPEELIFNLLSQGFTSLCHDGQNFFDTDHPAIDAAGAPMLVSDMQDGTDAPWSLMDTSRAVRPIVWQERESCDLQSLMNKDDTRVCRSDAGSFDTFLATNAAPYAHLFKQHGHGQGSAPMSEQSTARVSEAELAICRQLGIAALR